MAQKIVDSAILVCDKGTLSVTSQSFHYTENKLTAIGKDKLFLHSETETTVNSKGTAYMHGAMKTSYTNTPEDNKMTNSPQITDVMIEFRPDDSYTGQFGFDWLRVDDDGLEKETPYKNGVLAGAYNSKQDEPMYTGTEAYNALKNKYDQIPIKNESEPYLVPYLNIYPKTAKGSPTPPSTATLKVLKKIKIPVEKIIVEFEDKYLKVNGSKSPCNLSDILVNVDKSKKEISADTSISITCEAEFGTPKYLKVYAYPEPTDDAPSPERLLAGQLCVCSNDKTFRKTQKIVIVPLSIDDGSGKGKNGSYTDDEVTHLKTILYQALVYADVEVKDPLNLVGLKDFTSPLGKYNLAGNFYISESRYLSELYSDLRGIFNNKYKGHENDIVVFVSPSDLKFSKTIINDNFKGKVPIFFGLTNITIDDGNQFKSFSKEILLFPARQDESKLKTMVHEAGHALGLFHTWLEGGEKITETAEDGTTIDVSKISNDKKPFVFGGNEDTITHNLMSYSEDAPPKILWKWQWDIIHGR